MKIPSHLLYICNGTFTATIILTNYFNKLFFCTEVIRTFVRTHTL